MNKKFAGFSNWNGINFQKPANWDELNNTQKDIVYLLFESNILRMQVSELQSIVSDLKKKEEKEYEQ